MEFDSSTSRHKFSESEVDGKPRALRTRQLGHKRNEFDSHALGHLGARRIRLAALLCKSRSPWRHCLFESGGTHHVFLHLLNRYEPNESLLFFTLQFAKTRVS